MNISYSGDPESYIDCGRVTSYVKNARGERTYDFAGAKANQSYEVMNSGNLIFMERKMSLEGRVNLILEEAGPATTKVTVNTRYVIVRTIAGRSAAGGALGNSSDTISFNSGSGASFPANQLGQSTECVPRGTLEQEILSAIQ